jgi:uncharacterized coiled-coil protein SlyX
MEDKNAAVPVEEQPQPTTLGLSMAEFAALEERVIRAVSLVRRERQARATAEERANELETKLQAQAPAITALESELAALRAERDQMRERVERILSQLDSLEQ